MSSRTRALRIAAIAVVVLTITTLTPAADWTRWLGPEQNGSSPERDVFGDADPKLEVAWSRPLGTAYSAIAVADDRALTMFGDGKSDWLVAIDATSGEEVWRYRIDDMFPKIGGADGGQLSMPVVDAGNVYGLGARGQLFALRLKDGSEIWSLRIDEKLGAKQPHFGFTTAPLVVGDLLFVQTGGEDGKSLTALDKKSGKVRWATGSEAVGYQSPVLLELADKKQIVAVTNLSVSGLSPKDGTALWRSEHGLTDRDGWSTPLALGNDSFLLTARNESAAYRVTRGDGGYEAKEIWRVTNLKRNFAIPVVHEGHIYGYDADYLACVDAASGEQLWKTRSDAAGLLLVDGHLVIFASDGAVVVVEASTEGYREKASLEVTERGGYTFPSFADGAIYLRNLETIARVDVH